MRTKAEPNTAVLWEKKQNKRGKVGGSLEEIPTNRETGEMRRSRRAGSGSLVVILPGRT